MGKLRIERRRPPLPPGRRGHPGYCGMPNAAEPPRQKLAPSQFQ
jgi:hypothetical protein